MRNKRKILLGLLFAILTGLGCGGSSNKSHGSPDPSIWLLEEFQGTDLKRSSEIKSYKGESLYEYIDGGAELYHSYGFEEVVTATYKSLDSEIVIDIYQFDTSDHAYGLYSSIKPPEPGNISLGVDGFATENSLDFVKGRYLVNIVSYEPMETTMTAIKDIAGRLENMIPGTTAMPELFSLFPEENMVPGSEMIFSESFLGWEYLRDVYSVEYSLADSNFSLFASVDSGGEKFQKWSTEENIVQKGLSIDIKNLPFDGARYLAYEDDYRGVIIAGLKNRMLAGIIGYRERDRDYFSRWLSSLDEED